MRTALWRTAANVPKAASTNATSVSLDSTYSTRLTSKYTHALMTSARLTNAHHVIQVDLTTATLARKGSAWVRSVIAKVTHVWIHSANSVQLSGLSSATYAWKTTSWTKWQGSANECSAHLLKIARRVDLTPQCVTNVCKDMHLMPIKVDASSIHHALLTIAKSVKIVKFATDVSPDSGFHSRTIRAMKVHAWTPDVRNARVRGLQHVTSAEKDSFWSTMSAKAHHANLALSSISSKASARTLSVKSMNALSALSKVLQYVTNAILGTGWNKTTSA